ncbi:MAG TPA: UDP-N-acetylmuramate:L-alanyl-gamma-D-glutamyl-meso-diaminopimelate ligase [Thioalkalivibrio sp.]|nr:UDP-N-acetylmuramate:L-alanyl-gamma-D-glutamyl-meso-diaminopimelate ligase [Thioalkalivibrio sp.]
MHVHILGICGTFMGGVAALARAAGHEVTGSDANVYPPMSTQLEQLGIEVFEGYDPAHLKPAPDCVVIGNVMSRGNPAVEYVLNRRIPYTSGPQWLHEHVLRNRWVLGVAGTHGKTTTASLLAWILEATGLMPGFLIGGVPENFGVSARLGEGPFFVVEADEYDTAFFDKRSKFVHYHPRTLVLNNLEFDHADIFDDLEAIQRQFHHLVRTVPGEGLIVANAIDENIENTLARGCWSEVEGFSIDRGEWQAEPLAADGSRFKVLRHGKDMGTVEWALIGEHNMMNALAAIAAARHAGVPAQHAVAALGDFAGIKRRMQLRAEVGGVRVYDDFAHHPTAIRTTLAGLRARVGGERIIAVLEPRSNTMRMGVHRDTLADALGAADEVVLYEPPGLGWSLQAVAAELGERATVCATTDEIIDRLLGRVRPGDQLLILSNGSFDGLHDALVRRLQESAGRQG